MDGEKFFVIPIAAMLEFVIALQMLRPDTTTRSIVKWPDKIEQAFKENDIKYDASFDFDPKLVPLEKEAPEFFSKYGNPQIATLEGRPWFTSECANYFLEIQTFTGENASRSSRLATSSFFGNKSWWFN
jgi:hypothetical protein